jgi:hypothetical protein
VRQALNAIEHPGESFTVARITFVREGQFLHMQLPSGRRIRYPYARAYADERGKTFTFRDASGGRWEWYHVLKQGRGAFGGLVAENATQALCRDIFVEAMLQLEAASYHVVAHLHDEFVCEVPNNFGSLDEFRGIITTPPVWAPDFPIATKARIADRFIEIKTAKTPGPENRCNEDDESPPITPEEPEEINIGLKREGIESINIGAAATATEPPPMPPLEIDELEPKPAAPRYNGNGYDDDGYTFGTKPHGATTDRYVYKDARGLLFMRVTRTNSKTFPTEHWQDGRWVNGWPATVVPYRLPELLAAPATEPVWIAEGEKDADNVAALGLIATTNPGGAKVWQSELAQWFKDKQFVYILEDNDEPGRGHRAKILAALTGIVPNIAVVSFPELPEKGDVSDWLMLGGNKKLLIARAEQALKRSSEYRTKLQSIRASEVTMTAVQWLWPSRFALGKLGLIVGLHEEGKGQVLCYIAAQVTKAGPGAWPCGEGYAPKGNVILLTAEDAIDDTVAPRLEAAGADRTRIEIINMVGERDSERMFSLHTDLALLREKIMEVGNVVLVLVDPISAYFGVGKVDSYRTTDVRAVLGPLVSLATELKVAVIGIMHFNKKLDVTNVLLRISDSLAYGATARHVYGVVNDPDNHRKLMVRAKITLPPAAPIRHWRFASPTVMLASIPTTTN